ncbi:TadE/TadG family type IV pilus assembly protein [Methylobacterium sp. JK268]
MAPALPRWRAFGAERRAIAAVEFALVLPLLLTISLGGFQLVAYIDSVRRVERVAASVGQMLTQADSGDANTALVTANDLLISAGAATVLFPYVLQDAARRGLSWTSAISINAASIRFTPVAAAPSCGDSADMSRCYAATVVWTTKIDANHRACGVPLRAAPNEDPPAPDTLPRSIFGPGSVIAVDVAFDYEPVVGTQLVPKVRVARTVYLQPRYATLISADPVTTQGMVLTCPES